MTSKHVQQPLPPRSITGALRLSPRGWLFDLLVYAAALGLSVLAMSVLHGFDSGLSGSDEGSHFLNGYMIWSYVHEALGRNPLAYATDFYIHYPKISIGHWPPLYYVFLGALFFVLPHVPLAFLLVNLVVGALPALIVARVLRPLLGRPWAVLGALLCVALPISLANSIRLMLDQALGMLCLLAALLWSAYACRRTLGWALGFAAVAAASILVKGNGWVLVMFPLFHIALTGRWSMLWNWRTLAAAALALAVVGMWTVATYKISSDGFNYAWGWSYFALALPTFLGQLYDCLGPVGVLLAVTGIWTSLGTRGNPALRELSRTGLALVLATVIFHSLVPVDLVARYMSSAVFPLAMFMAIGAWGLSQRLAWAVARPWAAAALALVVLSMPGLQFLYETRPRVDLRMAEVAQLLSAQPQGLAVVVDGNPGVEGALTSEMALRDRVRQHYVVRSSQLLSTSDFMCHKYVLKADTPQQVLGLLDEMGAAAVVVAEGPVIETYEHNAVLKAALQDPVSPFRLAQVFRHERQDGQTSVYLRRDLVSPDRATITRVSFPAKAPK